MNLKEKITSWFHKAPRRTKFEDMQAAASFFFGPVEVTLPVPKEHTASTVVVSNSPNDKFMVVYDPHYTVESLDRFEASDLNRDEALYFINLANSSVGVVALTGNTTTLSREVEKLVGIMSTPVAPVTLH